MLRSARAVDVRRPAAGRLGAGGVRVPRRRRTRACGHSTTRRSTQLREKYGFTPTPAWLDHLRLSSVRLEDGGSGSFVSPRGLVLTNHHVALGQLQKASTPQKNYVADGFYAKTAAEELKSTDLEVNVLMSMENVTAARAGRGAGRRVGRAGARGAQEGHRRHRAGEHDEDRPPLRRRAAVSGQRVLAVPVQEIHRRAPGVRARAADRVLRRRSGQLHVSALRLRHGAVPRLREQRPGGEPRLPEVVRQRAPPTASWCSSRAIPGSTDRLVHRRAARDASATSSTRSRSTSSAAGSPCCASTASGAPSRRGRRRACCFGLENAPRRTKASLRGCRTRS